MGCKDTERIGPDVSGLPEFYVTDVIAEVAGPNIRMIFGAKRRGEINWIFSMVMPADMVIVGAKACNDAAIQAFNSFQMLMPGCSHH